MCTNKHVDKRTKMNNALTKNIGKGFIRLMWLGALATWVVYGIYIYNFAPGQWFKPSPNPADWGVFGDYVGGLLNPLFSFLAFIGVIITVLLQAKQLEVIREQANFEEIQRVMSTLSARIDGLLSSSPTAPKEQYRNMASPPKSVYELISALGTWRLNAQASDGTDWERWALTEDHLVKLQQTIHGELTAICLEFEALAWTLNQYSAAGGSEMVMKFYRYRHRAVLAWLDSMSLIDEHGQIQVFFKPKESYQYMSSNPAQR
jgi:hypothetical protein